MFLCEQMTSARFHAKMSRRGEQDMDAEAIPQWLSWARKIQALAQAGLHYAENEYDLDRYRQFQKLASEILRTNLPALPRRCPRSFSNRNPQIEASAVGGLK